MRYYFTATVGNRQSHLQQRLDGASSGIPVWGSPFRIRLANFRRLVVMMLVIIALTVSAAPILIKRCGRRRP